MLSVYNEDNNGVEDYIDARVPNCTGILKGRPAENKHWPGNSNQQRALFGCSCDVGISQWVAKESEMTKP